MKPLMVVPLGGAHAQLVALKLQVVPVQFLLAVQEPEPEHAIQPLPPAPTASPTIAVQEFVPAQDTSHVGALHWMLAVQALFRQLIAQLVVALHVMEAVQLLFPVQFTMAVGAVLIVMLPVQAF